MIFKRLVFLIAFNAARLYMFVFARQIDIILLPLRPSAAFSKHICSRGVFLYCSRLTNRAMQILSTLSCILTYELIVSIDFARAKRSLPLTQSACITGFARGPVRPLRM